MTVLAGSATAADRPRVGKSLWSHFLLRWLLCTVLLTALSAGMALGSATAELRQTLAAQLPSRLAESLQFSFVSNADTIALVSQALNKDLAKLSVTGQTGLLQNCRAHLQHLLASAAPPAPLSGPAPAFASGLLPVASSLNVDWTHGNSTETARFQLQCQLHTPRLLGINALLALLVILAMVLLPATLSQRLSWLRLGIKRHGYTLPGLRQALSIALAPASIRFDHQTHAVCIHGVTLPLPKTPYFYYAWYAGLRVDDSDARGWVLNPATDRPDRVSAVPLIELMVSAGGHQKAINDLSEHGLRAKILDQNRNKVKDELCRELGDALAADYLFESERDTRTARYRYRLTCSPARIKIVKQVPTSIDHPA